jgi:hypothetical protein
MTAITYPDTAPPPPFRRSWRAIAVVVLFLAAVAGGIAIHVLVATPPPPASRFPAMNPNAPEPQVTAQITAAIADQNPQNLAASYSAELLQAFQEAMAPVTDVSEIRYVGGLERDGETLASYVAVGQAQGQSVMTGFVVHVQNGQITGFN